MYTFQSMDWSLIVHKNLHHFSPGFSLSLSLSLSVSLSLSLSLSLSVSVSLCLCLSLSLSLSVSFILYFKVFLKILQNSQENTCARVSFLIKLQAKACNLIKKRLQQRSFLVNFKKFLRTPFLQNTSWRNVHHFVYVLLIFFRFHKCFNIFHLRKDFITNRFFHFNMRFFIFLLPWHEEVVGFSLK